jgi:hypothetical protein
MVYQQFIPDPLCYVPINPNLKCGEEWTTAVNDGSDENDDYDDDDHHHSPITFHMTLPSTKRQHCTAGSNVVAVSRLNFNCRDKSSGVLLPSEPIALSTKSFEDDEHIGDPFFFHTGYYLEAKTGFVSSYIICFVPNCMHIIFFVHNRETNDE